MTIERLRRLVGKIAAIAQAGDHGDLFDAERAQLRQTLEQVWHAHAVYLAPRYGVMASEPGYIAHGSVLAPIHLVEDIPGPTQLAELVEIGLAVRVRVDSTICLSGSAAMLSALEYVGDLDFCEYAEYHERRGGREVAAELDEHVRRSTAPICQRVKLVGPPPLKFSCDTDWDANAWATIERRIDGGCRHLKLDFVARSDTVGVVEATNVLLLLDDARAATLAKSFAGQEVPIGEAGTVLPRPLCDPLQLGHYIHFLRRQIDAYLESDPVKALKRGLSLARVMFLDASGEAILELLRHQQGALRAAIAAREALLDELSSTACTEPMRRAALEALRTQLLDRLLEMRRALAGPPRDDWATDVRNTLKSLTMQVQDLIASA